jgi:hypothetical protein|tara:strand:- start:1230 stop:1547 length:318 start_codon:yes stop_codon:yes gene_type:complete
MNRFLYFKDGVNDAYCNSADNLLAIRQTGDTTVTVTFKPRSNDAGDVDSIALTITDETEVAVCEAIINAINSSTSPFVVVFDAAAGEGVHSDITASAITLASLAA